MLTGQFIQRGTPPAARAAHALQAVLRDNANLLRQRRATHWPLALGGTRRCPRALRAAAYARLVLHAWIQASEQAHILTYAHRHRRARHEDPACGRVAR